MIPKVRLSSIEGADFLHDPPDGASDEEEVEEGADEEAEEEAEEETEPEVGH